MHKLRRLAVAGVAMSVLALPAAAFAHGSDRDHDKLPDRWEARYHLGSAAADIDGDGLNALGELRSRTSPRDADSDDDGVLDGKEDLDGDGIANEDERGLGFAKTEDEDVRDEDDDDLPDADDDSIDSLDSADSLDASVDEDSVDSVDEDSVDSVDEDSVDSVDEDD